MKKNNSPYITKELNSVKLPFSFSDDEIKRVQKENNSQNKYNK